MVDKNRWLNEIHEEEPKSSQLDISWSSSETENEQLLIKDPKKNKAISLRWIKSIENSEDDLFSSPDQSPIINSVCIEDLSPILTENTNSEYEESSPVIGKRRKLEQIRSKFKKAKKIEIIDCSPDLVGTQYTQIIDSESRDFLTIESDSAVYSSSSQHCSGIVQYDSSTNSESLYHQPTTKRKRSKKKGLASLLQKTLNLQKNRLSIWKHELYMKKSSDTVQGVINFEVLDIRKEYGSIFLECNEIYTNESEKRSNLILILISKSENIDVIKETMYKMYPPYESKIVAYKSQEITCHFNVTRIVKQIIK